MSTNAAAAQALLTCAQWKVLRRAHASDPRSPDHTHTALSPAWCGCASTLDYAVFTIQYPGFASEQWGSMCAMSCGYITILYVYPACL